jgi:hypothetical protein
MFAPVYPVRVDGALDRHLARWLWLVKWFLAIPHYVVLVFLWLAFAVLSVVAFFAILFTGRYPQAIFDFNVGVLRWTWRVQYYAYGALATDRYPPFSLRDDPGYPARLQVEYPQRLSRGLVLVRSLAGTPPSSLPSWRLWPPSWNGPWTTRSCPGCASVPRPSRRGCAETPEV